jgi:hypothetical protein
MRKERTIVQWQLKNQSKYSIAYTLGAGDGDGLKKNNPCHTFANAKLKQWNPTHKTRYNINLPPLCYCKRPLNHLE